MIKKKACVLLLVGFGLAACSDIKVEEPKPYITTQDERIRQKSGTIHGNPNGFVLYSTRENGEANEETRAGFGAGFDKAAVTSPGGPVNSYLWQASLESLDFMPLAQADSRGGVIITDWYAPPETPEERFKITVYILDTALRADALKVAVFRQVDGDKGWVDASVADGTATGLEDNILTRARELRLATTGDASTS
ncbi:MAG: DUF3576 domain-containing protein [Geminicoccaceae bacterium]